MKFPVLFVAAAALSACSTQTPEQSAGTPLKPLESLDIAEAAKKAPNIEPAKAVVRTENPAPASAEPELAVVEAPTPELTAPEASEQQLAAAELPEQQLDAAEASEQPLAVAEALEPQVAALETPEPQITVARAPAANSDAVCNRGVGDQEINFILCEDGALRKAGVVAALSAPHDPELTLESVASTYGVAPQIFTGIQTATYGTLVNGNRQAPRSRGKHKAQTGLVQINGKIYEVYQLSSGGKTGTIFVEQKDDS